MQMETEFTIRMTRQDAEELLISRNGHRLNKSKIANNTYLYRLYYTNTPIGEYRRRQHTVEYDITMRLHGTDIVCWKPSGAIVLKTGGWYSTTTKNRLAMVVPIYQKNWAWYIGDGIPFYDYMVINKYGRILERESSNATL